MVRFYNGRWPVQPALYPLRGEIDRRARYADMNLQTHLFLVSAQATPNLTPVLDPETAPKRVILLVSPDMRRRADWMEALLRSRANTGCCAPPSMSARISAISSPAA